MLVNLCPHPVAVARDCDRVDGAVLLPVAGLARVQTNSARSVDVDGTPVYEISYGEVTGLPDPAPGVTYVVSLVVLQACPDRRDLVAPGTGPQDGAIRDAVGKIIAVTRFVRLAGMQGARPVTEMHAIIQHLAKLGHDEYRDRDGECPLCSLGQPNHER